MLTLANQDSGSLSKNAHASTHNHRQTIVQELFWCNLLFLPELLTCTNTAAV
jgi:hypothetical protein